MEQAYIVSSRKYRPATFDTVISQKHVTSTLKNAVKNKQLAQAFLFCGPRGVGKTTCARILAKTINCLNPSADAEPCNTCDNCRSFNQSASFNIYELDAASNNSVEDIRSLVDQVRYAPQGAKYKVYIIDEVHMLSQAAFNAFLKTLEEPPSYAIFILATTERHKILPTILSRCQIYNFNRIKVDEIVEQLRIICEKEGVDAEDEALFTIARKADGAMRDALTMFDQMISYVGNKLTYSHVAENLNILDYEYYFSITDALIQQNSSRALLLFDEIIAKGFDGHLFIYGMAEHFRNLLVSKDTSTLKLMEVPESALQKYQSQSQKTGPAFILNALQMAGQADINYKSSKNQRLHVEMMLIKMAHINSLIDIGLHDPKTSAYNTAKINSPVPESRNTVAPAKSIGITLSKDEILKDIRQKKQNEVAHNPEKVESNIPVPSVILPLEDSNTLEELKLKIFELAKQKDEKNLVSSFNSLTFSFSSDRKLLITAPVILARQLEDYKMDIMKFLRELTGESVQIDIQKIQMENTTQQFYTVEEKFKRLLVEYPNLADFVRKNEIRIF